MVRLAVAVCSVPRAANYFRMLREITVMELHCSSLCLLDISLSRLLVWNIAFRHGQRVFEHEMIHLAEDMARAE